MRHAAELCAILQSDPERVRILELVRSLNLRDAWIGAGLVRNAVWDYLHGRPLSQSYTDVDVVFFDTEETAPDDDKKIETRLRGLDPTIAWSVKNQARMNERNGDRPYVSTVDAIGHWPETATAVAARCTSNGAIEIIAPYDLDDLFALIVRPTTHFAATRVAIVRARAAEKGWLRIWPNLCLEL